MSEGGGGGCNNLGEEREFGWGCKPPGQRACMARVALRRARKSSAPSGLPKSHDSRRQRRLNKQPRRNSPQPCSPLPLTAGVAHVVDLGVAAGGVPKPPVLRLVPLPPLVGQHLPALHAALQWRWGSTACGGYGGQHVAKGHRKAHPAAERERRGERPTWPHHLLPSPCPQPLTRYRLPCWRLSRR